jgi:hypothetical protein
MTKCSCWREVLIQERLDHFHSFHVVKGVSTMRRAVHDQKLRRRTGFIVGT